MAKALMGYLGQDPRTTVEIARLRTQVRELKAELAALREEQVVTIDSPLPVESVDVAALERDRATPALT